MATPARRKSFRGHFAIIQENGHKQRRASLKFSGAAGVAQKHMHAVPVKAGINNLSIINVT